MEEATLFCCRHVWVRSPSPDQLISDNAPTPSISLNLILSVEQALVCQFDYLDMSNSKGLWRFQ
jgi:hypothetical protein